MRKDYGKVTPMKIIIFGSNDRFCQDQWVQGLGYIYRNGSNFLPSIVRLEELLSGTLKLEGETAEAARSGLLGRYDWGRFPYLAS